MRRALAGLVLTIALFSPSLLSQQNGRDPSPAVEMIDGRPAAARAVLVRFREGATPALDQLATQDPAVIERVSANLHRVSSRGGRTGDLIARLRAQPHVLYAEPDFLIQLEAVPGDPLFPQQWHLRNTSMPGADIGAAAAWDITTGSSSIVIGIVDSGVDYRHPDLGANMWSAPSAFTVTIGGTTLTCPAGSHGFNAVSNSCDPMDDHHHGTAMAGMVGAVANNGAGVSGINWNGRLMALKFMSASGTGFVSDAIKAIDFAIQVKSAFAASGAADIRVLSNSWGMYADSLALREAVWRANDAAMLFSTSSGNESRNNDTVAHFPSNYDVPNVVAVAATSPYDELTWYSNYGAATVHLAAPGDGIWSTYLGGSYRSFTGTSSAAAVLSGAAALVLSRCPMTTTALRQLIFDAVDPNRSLIGKTSTGGRLHVDRALRLCTGGNAAPWISLSAPPHDSRMAAPGTVALHADAQDVDGAIVRVDFHADSLFLGSDTTRPFSVTWSGIGPGYYSFTAVAHDDDGATTRSTGLRSVYVDPPPSHVPPPWVAQDVGQTYLPGSAVANTDGSTTVYGAGEGIGAGVDSFHFVSQPLSGNGEIVARVRSFNTARASSRAGIMIRSGVDGTRTHAAMLLSAEQGVAFERRTAAAGQTATTSGGPAAAPYWIKLVRAGQTITGYRSPDGASWTEIGQTTFGSDFPATALFGLAVSSDDRTRHADATFDHVSVNAHAPPPPSANTVVLWMSEIPSSSLHGNWTRLADATAAGGYALWNRNNGQPKIAPALAAPAHYFETTFQAAAGTAYHVWIRMRAEANAYANDSVHLQFNDSVTQSGAAALRIGSPQSAEFVLQGGSSDTSGHHGWGWTENGWGTYGAHVYFATSGTHTLRVQQREDGAIVDHIVLSPDSYLTNPPGPRDNDTRVLQASGGPAPPGPGDTVVVWTSRLQAAEVHGTWIRMADTTAAGGAALWNRNRGEAKIVPALASPSSYFEATFEAAAGEPYHVWIRMRAEGESKSNDSVHLQFSDSVNASGAPIVRIGSTQSAELVLQGGSSDTSAHHGWGWTDNGWGLAGTHVYFATTGAHTLRVQQREDGAIVDQIVLSRGAYLTSPPGPRDNDTTILPPDDPPSTSGTIVLWAADGLVSNVHGNWSRLSDGSAAGGAALWNRNNGQPKIIPALSSPSSYFEMTFEAPAGRAYHVWIRMRAEHDSWSNDSVHLQFSDSVDASGTAIMRIGSPQSGEVVLQSGPSDTSGPHGWGWTDNGWDSPGTPVYFAGSGTHVVRIQQREDGAIVDQIVLSPDTYLSTRPGSTDNDNTIVQ